MSDVPTLISALGDYGFADNTDTEKVRALQGAIWAIERLRPWPFLEASLDLNFDGASPTPTNMPAQWKATLRAKWYATGKRIKPVRLDDLEDILGTSSDYTLVDAPSMYYVEGGVLKFWPIPPVGTGTAKLRYLQWSAAITSTSVESAILIPPRHHEVVMFGALTRLYDKEDDPELAVRFEQQYQQALNDMVEDLFHQQFDEPDFIRVLDPNDWDSLPTIY